jgi:hypothetical protein
LEYRRQTKEDSCRLEVSLDGKSWKTVWQSRDGGSERVDVSFDAFLEPHELPVKYSYSVRIRLESSTPGGLELHRAAITTDVMMAPLSLPRLKVGKNTVSYDDKSESQRTVRISHRWQECHDKRPPEHPLLQSPRAGQFVTDSMPVFRWSPIEDAVAYHIRVSLDPSLAIVYRPSLDTIVGEIDYRVPFTGVYNSGTTYFWSVRSCDKLGVWSEWAPAQEFQWKGPGPPVELTMREEPQGCLVIGWKPNPEGSRPARYDIYGSDEKGFSVSRESYDVMGLGRQPSNFYVSTEELNRTVVSHELTHPNANRTYYRIVAVDENGTESGCSDYIEMPHPFVYSKPVDTAIAGEPYEYKPRFTRSIGDLQYRYDKKEAGFWEAEEALYSLGHSPKWLSFGEDGVIRGTPGSDDIGKHLVEYCVVLLSFGMHSRTNHYVSYVLTVKDAAKGSE